jgi:hypothetical protein
VNVNEILALCRLSHPLREACCREPDRLARTAILEIAREEPGPRQDELFRNAWDNRLSARKIRNIRVGREDIPAALPAAEQTERPATPELGSSETFELDGAVITVQFVRPEVALADFVVALRALLGRLSERLLEPS